MKKLLPFLLAAVTLFSCNQKDKQQTTKEPDKKTENTGYIITKDGIGDIKIGMTQAELEKLLNQKLVLRHVNDTADVWADTAMAKYKEIDISLYFERQYNEGEVRILQLTGLGTSSPLCKTATGIGIGDEKPAILAAYDDNPIDMGPESEMVNDTTWLPSKTKYSINVKDDKWDKQLVFRLVNKKVTSLEASVLMGE
jgi:hypothetical protein